MQDQMDKNMEDDMGIGIRQGYMGLGVTWFEEFGI